MPMTVDARLNDMIDQAGAVPATLDAALAFIEHQGWEVWIRSELGGWRGRARYRVGLRTLHDEVETESNTALGAVTRALAAAEAMQG